jgi:hypothetical protein
VANRVQNADCVVLLALKGELVEVLNGKKRLAVTVDTQVPDLGGRDLRHDNKTQNNQRRQQEGRH